MDLLNEKNQVLVFGVEGTYGTNAAPAASKTILASDVNVKQLDSETTQRNNVTGTLGSQGAVTVARKASANFGVEFAHSGVATTAPAWGELLRACGMAEVIDASSVAYTFVDQAYESGTILYRLAKYQQNLLGSRGGFKLMLNSGEIPKLKFNFMSLYETPTKELSDLTGIDVTAYKQPVAVTEQSVALCQLFGVDVFMSKLEIDPGIKVEFIKDVGGEQVVITREDGVIDLEFRTDEATLVTQVENASNNVRGAFNFQLGSQVNKILKVDADQVEVLESDVNWQGGYAYCKTKLAIVPNARNNDLTITQM